MSTFLEAVLPALHSYREILRKKSPPLKAEGKIKTLRITRRQLHDMAAISVYQVAINVIKDIEKSVIESGDDPVAHFGLAEFAQYLKNTLNEFQVENCRVIHRKQEASRINLEIIQLITLPVQKINNDIETKLTALIQMINKYASNDQLLALTIALQKQIDKHPLFKSLITDLKII